MKILITLLILKCTLFAQIDTTLKDYFPMQVGNIWQYYSIGTEYHYYQVKVIGDTVMPNGKQYRVFWDSTGFFGPPVIRYYRIDNLMNVWQFGSWFLDSCNGESLIFKLNIPDSTLWKECKNPLWWGPNSDKTFPALLRTREIFYSQLDIQKTTKTFCGAVVDTVTQDTLYGYPFDYALYGLAKGIGMVRRIAELSDEIKIMGALIDGVKYGYIVNVEEKNKNSITYSLSQNKPNPFNSYTIINFSISKMSLVRLKIFDSLGREIGSLVNEMKHPGNYQVVFNTNKLNKELSSGIYYYTLFEGNNFITKKMVYLK